MRKPIVALGLSLNTVLGAINAAGVLAATPVRSANGFSPFAQYTLPGSAEKQSNGVSGSAIVQTAMRYLGYPYTATGASPATGFSCIGFVSFVYRQNGIPLPGDLQDAYDYAPQVSFSSLQPGDILYFQNTIWPGISHAAIYIGGGRFIHAEWYNRGVVISSFTNDPVDGNYWTGHYLGANRPWGGAAVSAVATPVPVQPPPTPRVVPTPVTVKAVRRVPSGPTVLVQVPALNVRAHPSLRAVLRTVVPQGLRLVVLGERSGWYRVALPNGTIGWVVGAGIGKGWPTRRAARRVAARTSPKGGVAPTVGNPTAPVRTSTQRRPLILGAVTVQVNGLRVHTAPSLVAPVIGSAGRYQRLAMVQRTNQWIKVELPGGGLGWVSSLYVRSRSLQRTRMVRTTIRRSSYGEPRARAALNVRAMPSLSGAILSVLLPGGSYQILRWFDGWARVRLSNGTVGWISGSVLGAYSSPARTIPVKRAARKVTSLFVASSVARAALNVRQRPSIGATIASVVPAGGSFQVLGWLYGWAHVRLANGGTGWISGSVFATAVSAAPATSATTVRPQLGATAARSIVTAGVRLHSAPGLSKPTIGLVAAGTHVQILGSIAGWAKVRLPSSQTGYILGTYVQR